MVRKHWEHETVQSKRAICGGVPNVDGNAKPDTFPYCDCGEYTDSLTLTDHFAIALTLSNINAMSAPRTDEQHQEAGHLDKVQDGSTRRNK